MKAHRTAVAALAAAVGVASYVLVALGQGATQLPLAPMGPTNNAISPALEGWHPNADGTSTFLIGYYNRNDKVVEVPVGPNNRIEPGGPDMGQPTRFLPNRHRGMFSITVPKDFGNKKLAWTLTANGQTHSITLWLNPPYVLNPFRNDGNGNTPPKVRFEQNGPEFVAIPTKIARTLDAAVRKPVPITLWVTDVGNTIVLNPFAESPPAGNEAGRATGAGRAGRAGGANDGAAAGSGRGRGTNTSAPIRVTWTTLRGPAEAAFDSATPPIAVDGRTTTNVTFPQPGEYRLHAQVNDASGDGGGGDGCCWTNVQVQVNVK